MLFFKLLRESLVFALKALGLNLLRSFLSLLGITIGIFAIISVFTMVDTMESSIRDSVKSLGDDVIFVQRMPWAPEKGDGEYAWWKYFRRPDPTIKELDVLNDQLTNALACAFVGEGNRTIEYFNNSVERASVKAVTYDFNQVRAVNFTEGRYFSPSEAAGGKNYALIGANIAEGLFPNTSPLNKDIKVSGRKFQVIGVFEKEGEDLIGTSIDNDVVIPAAYANSIFDVRSMGTYIMVKSKPGVTVDEMRAELVGVMRGIRRLRPREDNNFALNEQSILSSGLDELFGMVHGAGFIIGIFSIIVGGFSIANIMFVSVRERTPHIGIQKSLGAKNGFILRQFLFEAVILCLIGGLIGLLFIFLGTLLAGSAMDMEVTLTLKNIVLGIVISVTIGVVSGIIPALFAARLDPVEAIRAN